LPKKEKQKFFWSSSKNVVFGKGKKLRESQFFVRVLAFPIWGKTKGQIFAKFGFLKIKDF